MHQVWSRLRRAVSRNEWAARLFHTRRHGGDGPARGLLLIQIDGLSFRQLERAIANAKTPFLGRLLRRGDYKLLPMYSGLPSATPAVQGELFYNVCCAVPAFRFFDPELGDTSMFVPACAKAVEQKVAGRGEDPLLKDGSSWSNIYSGGADAEDTHFCPAACGWRDLFLTRPWRGFMGVLLFDPVTVARVPWLLAMELIFGLAEVFHGVWRGEPAWNEIKFVASRLLVGIGLRETIVGGAAIDLARGLPVVHVNFLGYDERAHRRGPSSYFAHRALKGIDRGIATLFRAARRSVARDYRVWIFSDHGQESVRSYLQERGAVQRAVRDGLKQFVTNGAEPVFDAPAAGPVGHVYLRSRPCSDALDQLSRWLVRERGLPGVIVAGPDGEPVWVHRRGATPVREAGSVLPHTGPVRQQIARDLLRLCEHECAGDLVLLGFDPHGDPWSFSLERGAHGGFGPEETSAFALLPENTRLPEDAGELLRPAALREAALHALGRKRLPRARRAAPATSLSLRVLTYNVHSCVGMDGVVSPHRIAHVLERYEPDIAALQEIDLGRERTRRHDQARVIAAELDMTASFCPAVIRNHELYGHAILSHLPAETICTGILPTGPRRRREPRAAMLVKVTLAGTAVFVLNTHFGLGWSERAAQAAELLTEKWFGQVPGDAPFIVCGDFNMVPGTAPYRHLTSRLRDAQRLDGVTRAARTFPSVLPVTRIDHVFVSRHFTVENVRVPRNDLTRIASDHLPLIVDLRLAL